MKSKNYTISFFFRRINDLEQYLPLLNFMIKKKYNLLLLSLDENFQIKDFKKFNYYNKFKNIKINYFKDFLIKKNFFLKIIYKILIKLNFNKVKLYLNSLIFTNKNIKDFININNIKTCVFDFPINNSNYLNIIKKFKDNDIKIFGIHHGIWVRDINLNNKKIKKLFLSDKKISKFYDRILVFNKEYLQTMRILKCKNKFLWYGLLSKFENKYIIKKTRRKLIKVLYLDHSSNHGINKINVVRDLKKLKKFKNIKITIRPNTSIEFNKNKDDLKIFYYNNLKKNISYKMTEKLIRENDIIINPISSSVINFHLPEKILIHPLHYISDEKMIWQRYKSCFEIKSTNDLFNIINKYKKNKLDLSRYKINTNRMIKFLNGFSNYKLKLEMISNEIAYEKKAN